MNITNNVTLVGPDKLKQVAQLVSRAEVAIAPIGPSDSYGNKLSYRYLPPLLAGPQVRRLEKNCVWIWFATSLKIETKGWVVDPYNFAGPYHMEPPPESSLGEGTASPLQMGENLYIYMLPIKSKADMYPMRKFLGYNVSLSIPSSHSLIFTEKYLLRSEDVALSPFQLPTFFLPDHTRKRARFFQGSCRKLHGEGADVIPLALKFLEKNSEDPDARPPHLILTGDQVYADDVSQYLQGGIRRLGVKLLGKREKLPMDLDWPIVKVNPGNGSNQRGTILKEHGFTANKSKHVMGFGEYAALYLISWSPALWEEFYPWNKPRDADKHIKKAGSTADDMRKFMANISTYMIFDDHEVTDDWNLTFEWAEKVYSSSLARRVVSNGLAAYAAFQALGNYPSLDSGMGFYLSARMHLDNHSLAQKKDSSLDSRKWPDIDSGIIGFHGWDFIAEMHPRVIFLNTRTQRLLWPRSHSEVNHQSPPGLLSEVGRKQLLKQVSQVKGHANEPVVIVSPAPVIGFILEEIQRIPHLANIGGSGGEGLNEGQDPEAWSFHPRAYFDFLNTLIQSGHRRFVFLSGDVHYAFSAIAQYRVLVDGSYKKIDIVQLTSSSLHNRPKGVKKKGLALLGSKSVDKIYRRMGWEGEDRSNHPQIRDEKGGGSDYVRTFGKKWDFELRWRYVPIDSGLVVGGANSLAVNNNIGLVDLEVGSNAERVTQILLNEDKHVGVTNMRWNQFDSTLNE